MSGTRGRLLFALLLLWLPGSSAAAPAGTIVDSGHRRPITFLRYDARTSLLFSASEEGLVIAWDTRTRKPVSRLELSHLPVRMLAVHPTLPEMAVVESDLAETRLSVWDYQNRTRLFSVELEVLPSSIGYSSTGRYLVVTRERHEGLRFFDPSTGAPLALFSGGFGIVSFVSFNPDDTVMMSYQPEGEVRYWDVATELQRFRTIGTEPFLGLVGLSGSPDSPKDSLVGSTGRQLELVDIVRSGAVKARAPLGDIFAIEASPDGQLACLSRSAGGGTLLTRWQFRSGPGLVRLSDSRLEGETWPGGEPTALAAGPDRLYLGTADGTIVARPDSGPASVFSRNEIAAVSDVAAIGSSLFVGLRGTIREYDGAIGAFASAPEKTASFVHVSSYQAPFGGEVRFAVSPRGELWVWSPESDPGALYLFRPGAPFDELDRLELPGPIKSVSWTGDELGVVERSGRSSVLRRISPESASFRAVFEYVSPGANVIVSTPRSVLIGKSVIARGESALVSVDRATGETVPVPGGEIVVFDLQYDAGSDSVLSLGVVRDPDPATELERRSGADWSRVEVLTSYRGEDTGADMTAATELGAVYTSLGYELSRGAGGSWVRQATLLRLPRRLVIAGGYLVSLNTDATVAVWEEASLEAVADLYTFADGEWLLEGLGGERLSSAGGELHVSPSGSSARPSVP